MYKYYLTQRAPGPGAIPGGAAEVLDYGGKKYVDEIGGEAWGEAVYDRELTEAEADGWELSPEGRVWYPLIITKWKRGTPLAGQIYWQVLPPRLSPVHPREGTQNLDTRVNLYRYFRTEAEAAEAGRAFSECYGGTRVHL